MARKDISDLQVLQAYVDAKALRAERNRAGLGGPWPEELLEQRTGQCPKVCWAAMERADARGLLEWGMNLRGGWLTEKGVLMHAMHTDNEPRS